MSRLNFASLKFGNQPYSPRKEMVGSPHELWHLYKQECPTPSKLTSDQVPGGQVYLRPSNSHRATYDCYSEQSQLFNYAQACVCLKHKCMWGQVPKENQHTRSPAAGVTNGCEHQCLTWDPNSGPLEEQHVLLTAGPPAPSITSLWN